MITLIDIGLGNIKSVANALKRLKVPFLITSDPEKIANADKLIFPGVGNFCEASKRLDDAGIASIIRERVIINKVPLLGICLGMQLFASYGDEGGVSSKGLDLIKGRVSLLPSGGHGLRLPHIGWNDVSFENFKLFDSIQSGTCFYFVHSYALVPEEKGLKVATANYGSDFVAAVQKDNIVGTQFHPEKSQDAGLKLLKNFCEGRI